MTNTEAIITSSYSLMGIVEVSKGLLTPLIALIALYIAYQQYKVNSMRLKHDQDERRIVLFRKINEFMRTIISRGKIDRRQAIEFTNNTVEVDFLFGKDISRFIDELTKMSFRLATIQGFLHAPQPLEESKRHETLEEEEEILKWVEDNYLGLQEKFKKYFHIS